MVAEIRELRNVGEDTLDAAGLFGRHLDLDSGLVPRLGGHRSPPRGHPA